MAAKQLIFTSHDIGRADTLTRSQRELLASKLADWPGGAVQVWQRVAKGLLTVEIAVDDEIVKFSITHRANILNYRIERAPVPKVRKPRRDKVMGLDLFDAPIMRG